MFLDNFFGCGDFMNWWHIIKGSCCESCGDLNKEAGGVAFGGHGNDPSKFNIKYGGDKDDEEIED